MVNQQFAPSIGVEAVWCKFGDHCAACTGVVWVVPFWKNHWIREWRL